MGNTPYGRIVLALLLSAVLLGSIGYALIFHQPPGGREIVKLEVPFVHQKEWFCSEASASMVLKYYNHDLSQDQIHDMGYERYEDMLPLFTEYLNAQRGSMTMADLERELDEGNPVMIRVRRGMYLHTMVVVGYGEGYVCVHDPAIGPYRKLKLGDLLNEWRYTDYDAMNFSRKLS